MISYFMSSLFTVIRANASSCTPKSFRPGTNTAPLKLQGPWTKDKRLNEHGNQQHPPAVNVTPKPHRGQSHQSVVNG